MYALGCVSALFYVYACMLGVCMLLGMLVCNFMYACVCWVAMRGLLLGGVPL